MGPKIFAHRTGMAIAPPNSMAGLIRCANIGADGIECDLTFSNDGKPVIWLNSMNSLLKPIGYNWSLISQLNFKQISALERKDCKEKIMTIEDVWHFISNSSLKVFFDVKNKSNGVKEHLGDLGCHFEDITPDIIGLVDREIIQPAILKNISHRIGFVTFYGGVNLLMLAKIKDSNITTSLMIILPWLGKFPWDSFDEYSPLLDSIIIGWKDFNQWNLPPWNFRLMKIIQKAKEHNLNIEGGIANTRKELLWLQKFKCTVVWTDDPLKIYRYLIAQNIKR